MPFTLSVVVVAVAVSMALGGRVSRIGDHELRGGWLLGTGLVLQLGVDQAAGRGLIADAGAFGSTVLVVSQVLILAWILRNAEISPPGLALVGAGLVLNAIVMTANGAMPVDPQAMAALGLGDLQVPPGKHTLLTEATRFAPLGDVIPLPPLRSIISVGDVVLAVGLVPLTHALMRGPRPSPVADDDAVRRAPAA